MHLKVINRNVVSMCYGPLPLGELRKKKSKNCGQMSLVGGAHVGDELIDSAPPSLAIYVMPANDFRGELFFFKWWYNAAICLTKNRIFGLNMSLYLIVLLGGTPCILVVNSNSFTVVNMALFQDDHILLFTVTLVAAETPEEVKKPLKKKHKSPSVWERSWLAFRNNPTCGNVYTLML